MSSGKVIGEGKPNNGVDDGTRNSTTTGKNHNPGLSKLSDTPTIEARLLARLAEILL